MKAILILAVWGVLAAEAQVTYNQNVDPFPRIENLILNHTGQIEDYSWETLRAGMATVRIQNKDAAHIYEYAMEYTEKLKNLNKILKLPQEKEMLSLVQSIWATKSQDVPVERVWDVLMSYVKLQKSTSLLGDAMIQSAPSTHTAIFRGSVFPHLASTLNNFSYFHRLLAYTQNIRTVEGEIFANELKRRTLTILHYAINPYREALRAASAEISVGNNTSENENFLRVHQAVSLGKIFEGVKNHLNIFSVDEVSVLQNIDSYTSLPSPFIVYLFFLKENQNRMVQNLDAVQLKQMFSIIMLSDLLKFEDENKKLTSPAPMNEQMQQLGDKIRNEISQTLKAYQSVVQTVQPL